MTFHVQLVLFPAKVSCPANLNVLLVIQAIIVREEILLLVGAVLQATFVQRELLRLHITLALQALFQIHWVFTQPLNVSDACQDIFALKDRHLCCHVQTGPTLRHTELHPLKIAQLVLPVINAARGVRSRNHAVLGATQMKCLPRAKYVHWEGTVREIQPLLCS